MTLVLVLPLVIGVSVYPSFSLMSKCGVSLQRYWFVVSVPLIREGDQYRYLYRTNTEPIPDQYRTNTSYKM